MGKGDPSPNFGFEQFWKMSESSDRRSRRCTPDRRSRTPSSPGLSPSPRSVADRGDSFRHRTPPSRERRRRSISRRRSREDRRSLSRDRYSSSNRRRHYSRSPNRRRTEEPPRPCRVLGIFGLNYSTTRRDLEREFGRYGRLDRVDLVEDPAGQSRGFGFVSFERQRVSFVFKSVDFFLSLKRWLSGCRPSSSRHGWHDFWWQTHSSGLLVEHWSAREDPRNVFGQQSQRQTGLLPTWFLRSKGFFSPLPEPLQKISHLLNKSSNGFKNFLW